MEVMDIPDAWKGSWEDLMHRAGAYDQILLLRHSPESLQRPIGQRAIGVVYDPTDERGNYVPTMVPNRYDAFVFIDKTEGLHPIEVRTVMV